DPVAAGVERGRGVRVHNERGDELGGDLLVLEGKLCSAHAGGEWPGPAVAAIVAAAHLEVDVLLIDGLRRVVVDLRVAAVAAVDLFPAQAAGPFDLAVVL